MSNIRSIIARRFVPNIEALNLFEYFLLAAISSLLIIRGFLALTGYPQLGGNGLHIAHMLWGGVFMLIAIIMMLGTINAQVKVYAAVLGGIGFGTFIDELGKFITADNNYFFQPTIALIYIIFVSLYLIFRWFSSRVHYSATTCAANAVEVLKEIVIADFDQEEKSRALQYLATLDHKDPVIHGIVTLIEKATPKQRNLSVYQRVKSKVVRWYGNILHKRAVTTILIGYFVIHTVLSLALVSIIFIFGRSVSLPLVLYGYFASIMAAGVCVIGAMYAYVKKKRVRALELLVYSTLISIFLIQLFLFYIDQWRALIDLVISLSVYVILKFSLQVEKTGRASIE